MKYATLIILYLILVLLLTSTVAATDTIDVTFKVSGVISAARKNVSLLLNKKLIQTTGATQQERVMNFYNRSPNYVIQALEPFGYFEPIVQKQIISKPPSYEIHYHIIPGPVIKVTQVNVQIVGEGVNDPVLNRLIQNFPIKLNDQLNAHDYQRGKNSFYNAATQRGYFEAKFVQSQMIINIPAHQAHIILVFDTGPRYRFGETVFCGSTLRDSFLQRYRLYQQGDYYNSVLVQRLQQDLANSYYFKQVTVTTKTDEAVGKEIPVKVNLIPNNPRQYIFGLGYGTDTGVRATFGLQLRQVNDRGHYFNTILRASQNNSTLTTNYVIPGKRPAYDFYTLNAAIGSIDQPSGHSDSYKLGPSYTTRLTPKWNANMGVYFLDEHYHLQDVPSTDAQLVVSYFHIEHIRKQTLINPTKGYNLSFDLAGGPSTANISRSFIQERVQGKALYTTHTHTRFLVRGQLGRTDIDDINHLPLSLQLYAGGTSSIRGYSYNSIGPGRNLLVASGEVQQRVYKSFYLAAFYDVGNVGNKDYLSDLKQGVGPGFVFLTPIGSLELTIARRIADGIDQPSYMIQFSMGPDLL